MDTNDLQKCIHHRFEQVKLLETALTHSSYANEQEGDGDNERLEFLAMPYWSYVFPKKGTSDFPVHPKAS